MRTNVRTWALIAILMAMVCAGIVTVYAVNGLTGNASSATEIVDLRDTTSTAVSSLTTGKTWQIYKEVDFSDDDTSATYSLLIGTIGAGNVIRNVVTDVVRWEASGTQQLDVNFGETAAVNNADCATTGVLVTATLYVTVGTTQISVKPEQRFDNAKVKVWVLGEKLTDY